MNSARIATRWCFVAAAGIITVAVCGCQLVSADSFSRTIDVRNSTSESSKKPWKLAVGMTKADVEHQLGKRLRWIYDELAVIDDQYGGQTLFDDRKVYVYFDNNQVAAIIVRGNYFVWL